MFEPKELLYRKEEKRKVIPLYWSRIAAAVLLILAGGWFLSTLQNKNNHKQGNSVNEQRVAEKANQSQPQQNPGAEASKERMTPVDMKKNPDALVKGVSKDKPGNPQAKKSSKPVNGTIDRQQQQSGNTDLQIRNATGDEEVAMQKSNTTPELQSGGSRNAEVAPGQLTGARKTPPLLIAVAARNHTAEIQNEQPADLPMDNAISVIALNDQNKGITSFFKKIAKRMPGNETAENTKKLRVSVFQFSY